MGSGFGGIPPENVSLDNTNISFLASPLLVSSFLYTKLPGRWWIFDEASAWSCLLLATALLDIGGVGERKGKEMMGYVAYIDVGPKQEKLQKKIPWTLSTYCSSPSSPYWGI